MARPRVPKMYGIAQFTARLLSLLTTIAGLAILIRLSLKWGSEGKTYGVALAAVSAIEIGDKEKK
jgi:hypothetical protein